MKIIRAKDYADMSRKAANIISAQVIMKPNCVLGLATGGTPVGAYQQLVEWYNKGDIDFSEVTTVNLDEYRGLPKDHPESYWSFMHRNLFDHVNIDPAHIHLPDGTNPDADDACAQYNQIIHSVGGIDLQLLGLGPNGHIGFNEPGKAFELETHCVDLTEATIEANKRFFDGNEDLVPRQAYTMGINRKRSEQVRRSVKGAANFFVQRAPAMHKSGKRKPGRYDLRFCIRLALAACISFCTKITARFKVFFETDGMNDELDFEILSIGIAVPSNENF